MPEVPPIKQQERIDEVKAIFAKHLNRMEALFPEVWVLHTVIFCHIFFTTKTIYL